MTPRLPGYVIDCLLGSGSTGQVWRATRVRTGEPVALKWLPATDRQQRAAAQGEAAILSALDHPHLIRLRHLVPVTDALVLVLDLADGGSLADLLRRRGHLTPGEVVTALAPISAALAYAHARGVVHGDVSAANVLFTSIGLPLLADLGLARILGDDDAALSTPAYIDPAVASGFAPSSASDVFSLAAVAFHALTGRPVWDGDGAADLLAAAASGHLDDLEDRLTPVPAELRAVLTRALSIGPELRGTAAGLALDLRHSAQPTPLELAAGRERLAAGAPRGEPAVATRVGPRHAVGLGRAVGAVPIDRPPFERPGAAAPPSSSDDLESGRLTYGRRIAVPPRPPQRRLSLSGWRLRPDRRLAAGFLVAVAVVAAVGLAVTRDRAGGRQQPVARVGADAARSPAVPVTPAVRASPLETAAPVRSTPASPTPVAAIDATSAAAVLADLDRLRERAYAQRDGSLLSRVYVSGRLRSEDAAELDRLVRPGCTMTGVRTTYANVRLLSSSVTHPVLLTRATLAPATLECGGQARGVSLGSPPTTLRIELLRSPAGYLIEAQQVVP